MLECLAEEKLGERVTMVGMMSSAPSQNLIVRAFGWRISLVM